MWVVDVIISAYSKGEFNKFADINPAVWLMSANKIVSSPIAYRNYFQSISLQYADQPAINTFGWYFLHNYSISFKSTSLLCKWYLTGL